MSIPRVEFKCSPHRHLLLRQYTVPEIFELMNIDHLDLLHCDAQGVELAVIMSSADLFRDDRIKYCIFSTHHHNISHDPLTHQRCFAALLELGGRIIVEHDVNESYSGDGLIVGSSDVGIESFEISYNRYSQALFRNPLYDFEESMYPMNGLKSALRNSFVKPLYLRARALFGPF